MKISRRELLRLINGYSTAHKAVFTLKFTEFEDKNLEYTVDVHSQNSFKVITKIYNQENNTYSDLSMTVSSVMDLPLPFNIDFDILSVEETVYTKSNQIYSKFYYNALDLMQVYLPLFRVYGEQVVFLYKTLDGDTLKCYYINGRVFYTSRPSEQVIEIRQISLRDLTTLNPGSIVSFERLAKKLSYKVVYTQMERYARENDLKLSVIKSGMNMRGGY